MQLNRNITGMFFQSSKSNKEKEKPLLLDLCWVLQTQTLATVPKHKAYFSILLIPAKIIFLAFLLVKKIKEWPFLLRCNPHTSEKLFSGKDFHRAFFSFAQKKRKKKKKSSGLGSHCLYRLVKFKSKNKYRQQATNHSNLCMNN